MPDLRNCVREQARLAKAEMTAAKGEGITGLSENNSKTFRHLNGSKISADF